MNGLDDIDFLLTNKDKIEAWEKTRQNRNHGHNTPRW